MFTSPFLIKKNIVVVSDFFIEQLSGGAEMTLETLIQKISNKYNIYKINSLNLSLENLNKINESLNNPKFLFCNIANLDAETLINIPHLIKNYSIVECDYKYCKYRSEDLHKFTVGKDCDCADNSSLNTLISNFYSHSKNLFWMSKNQMMLTNKKLDIKGANQIVLGSLFLKEHIDYINEIKNNSSIKRNNKFVILKSPSWVKGYENALNYCKHNQLEYEEVWGLDYRSLLMKLRSSKGLVYLPTGLDTCPRLVIEAMMLGCSLILNEKVQIKDEEWLNEDKINSLFTMQEKIIKETF